MPTSTDVASLKINQLTSAQYNAAVQGGVIGEYELSILTDATTTLFQSASCNLSPSSWSSGTQTVNVRGVTASNFIIVSPAPSSIDNYTAADIRCTSQGSGTLTFTCVTTPSTDIVVNVAILG